MASYAIIDTVSEKTDRGRMRHTVKTAPTTEPVTLAEMRTHLGIVQSTETGRDSIITSRIISARKWAEHYTRTAFISQTLTGYDSVFPFIPECNHPIFLRTPLVSVTTIKYLDPDGVQQTLSGSKYLVDTVGGVVVPAYGESWPSIRSQLNSVQVEYVAGYANAAAVPEEIKDAIRFIVSQWEIFQSSIEGVVRPFTIPNAAKQLLEPYVDMRNYF
jgi:uncharacterized phiE125 gp8 family phage protein